MALTVEEKARVRYHLGFINISTPLAISLGIPDASQLQFIVESAMNNILREAEPGVRRCIQELDCIEDQMSSFRTSLEVSQAGNTKLRGADAFIELEQQYKWWGQKLADTLGTPINPFSMAWQQLNPGGGGVIEPT